jgi:hypothetical protein
MFGSTYAADLKRFAFASAIFLPAPTPSNATGCARSESSATLLMCHTEENARFFGMAVEISDIFAAFQSEKTSSALVGSAMIPHEFFHP